MSQQDESGEVARDSTEVAGQLTLEALDRYLAAAAEDREAAEDRSAQVIARFTKLTIAMMCVTMVIAGANVAMIFRQSSAVQPVVMAPPRPVETPTVVVQPAQPVVLPAPVPAPLESLDPPRPAEKIPLLGSQPPTRPRPAPATIPPRMARAPLTLPRPQPLLSVRNMDNDGRESGPVERW
jgi:hypothetical protein